MVVAHHLAEAVVGFVFVLAVEFEVLVVAVVEALDLVTVFRQLVEVILEESFAGAELFEEAVFIS